MSIKTVEFQPFTDQKPGTYVSLLFPLPPLSYPASFPSGRVAAWRQPDNDDGTSIPTSLSNIPVQQ